MRKWKTTILGLLTVLLLSAALPAFAAEEEKGKEEAPPPLTYEQAVKATENDCCR